MTDTSGDVRHNTAAHRFEAGIAPHLAMLVYQVKSDALELVHTEVPEQYQGQGLGGKLATAALQWARESGRKVIPSCPYVRSYIGKHPEYADLVAQ
jgi:predicted GNAT family acetyltransferase